MDGQLGVKSVPLRYNFDERLQMSQGVSQSATVETVLLANIPGAISVYQSSKADDKTGVDWFVKLQNGKALGVDCKIREQDYAQRGKDDLALETWSVVEKKKIGWTRDSDKHTDYVLWLWTDTGRWCLIPFHPLCAVFSDKWQEWKQQYQHNQQYTPWNGAGYHSECVFVPRQVVWRSIYNRFGGNTGYGAAIDAPQLPRTYHPPSDIRQINAAIRMAQASGKCTVCGGALSGGGATCKRPACIGKWVLGR